MVTFFLKILLSFARWRYSSAKRRESLGSYRSSQGPDAQMSVRDNLHEWTLNWAHIVSSLERRIDAREFGRSTKTLSQKFWLLGLMFCDWRIEAVNKGFKRVPILHEGSPDLPEIEKFLEKEKIFWMKAQKYCAERI